MTTTETAWLVAYEDTGREWMPYNRWPATEYNLVRFVEGTLPGLTEATMLAQVVRVALVVDDVEVHTATIPRPRSYSLSHGQTHRRTVAEMFQGRLPAPLSTTSRATCAPGSRPSTPGSPAWSGWTSRSPRRSTSWKPCTACRTTSALPTTGGARCSA